MAERTSMDQKQSVRRNQGDEWTGNVELEDLM